MAHEWSWRGSCNTSVLRLHLRQRHFPQCVTREKSVGTCWKWLVYLIGATAGATQRRAIVAESLWSKMCTQVSVRASLIFSFASAFDLQFSFIDSALFLEMSTWQIDWRNEVRKCWLMKIFKVSYLNCTSSTDGCKDRLSVIYSLEIWFF